jgi:hypothetical protein
MTYRRTVWNWRTTSAAAALGAVLALITQGAQPKPQRTSPLGYEDTPFLPGQKWRVHDIKRPIPRVVTPASEPGRAPSDAVVLFDGKSLSNWVGRLKGQTVQPGWKLGNGYMEVAGRAGDLLTKEKFGDAQFHIEWAAPAVIDGSSQWRGNSGVLLMSRYEIQVLDSYDNPTYADGQAGAIYGQYPPLVNASRKPGEWQTFDIVFEAPRFEGEKLVKPAYVSVFHNGVLMHHRQEIIGRMAHRQVGTYAPHGPEEPLMLQDHDTPVRYRNIWVRRLRGYDQP